MQILSGSLIVYFPDDALICFDLLVTIYDSIHSIYNSDHFPASRKKKKRVKTTTLPNVNFNLVIDYTLSLATFSTLNIVKC